HPDLHPGRARAPQAAALEAPSASLKRPAAPERSRRRQPRRQAACDNARIRVLLPGSRMKPYLLAVLGAFSLTACAQSDSAPQAAADQPPAGPATTVAAAPPVEPGSPDERARNAIRKLNAQVRIEHIGAAPLAGFREVIVGGQTLYVSDDGRYMLQGSLYDMDAKRDLSEASLAELRRDLLKTIPVKDRIVFAPKDPKYTVTVFTDVECGYCRKMHGEIAEYNTLAIAFEYVANPRMGLGSDDFRKVVAVRCSAARRKALTA